MAFGPVMQLTVGELSIELAPLTKETMSEFVAGMQQASVTKYLARHTAPTLEDEVEWFDKTRADRTNLIWGIWVVTDKERILIGNTALEDITKTDAGIHHATSGSMIFRKEYWGKGIASAIHMARTWYGFQHMGLDRIMSAVIQGNVASLKALQKSGYDLVYVERNTVFVDGKMRHQDNLDCLNPDSARWAKWWNGDRPTSRSRAARLRTDAAMKWASQHVKLV